MAGRRASLGLKVTPGIKERLDAAARANGRTQSQEAEARIELTFKSEDLLPQLLELAYGRELAGLLMELGKTMLQAGQFTAMQTGIDPDSWILNADAYNWAKDKGTRFINDMQPPGEVGAMAKWLAQQSHPPTVFEVLDNRAKWLIEQPTGNCPMLDPLLRLHRATRRKSSRAKDAGAPL
jgi:hypothetical protein